MIEFGGAVLRFFLLFLPVPLIGEEASISPEPPAPVASIRDAAVKESSGLDQSRRVPGRFWTLNDSGNGPVLYALDVEGRSLGSVRVEGAKNVDWETLAIDGKGRMWIGDVGNNKNQRRDATVYQVGEPGEVLPETLTVKRVLRVGYPDQKAFPPRKRNFDCEAMFVFEDRLYLLTKHRSDLHTKLYRVEDMASEAEQTLTLVERFENIGQVTGADLHADGRRLAVLTFSGVWLFEREGDSDRFLSGKVRRLPVKNWAMRQSEGIAWIDDDSLLISNEQRDLFRVGVEAFK